MTVHRWVRTLCPPAHCEPFYVNFNLGDGAPIDSIKLLSLIRPGAVTHGFDQNQRFIALSFNKYHGLLRTSVLGGANKIPPGDYLLFGVRSGVGGVPSVGKWLRIESENDVTAPAARDLQFAPQGGGVITVLWSAPGDDSLHGTAKIYKLKYRTDVPMTASNFDSSGSFLVNTNWARPSGDQESYTVTGLPACQTAYFGLRTKDEAENWSVHSFGYASTGCSGGGGGGGGCEHCQQGELSVRPAEGYVATQTEILRLDRRAVARGITLTHAGMNAFRLDSLELVDVTLGTDSLAVVKGGEILLGAREPAVSVETSTGRLTNWRAGVGYAATAGETLLVRFAVHDSVGSGSAVVLATEAEGAEKGGIRVQRPQRDGTWRSIAVVSPRPGNSTVVVENLEADSVRLVCGGNYRIVGVSRVVPSVAGRVARSMSLTGSEHSRLGGVGLTATGSSVVMEPGDMLQLDVADTVGAGRERLLRYRVSAAGGGAVIQRGPSATYLPAEFALGQNQPNPFGDGTVIRFALPVRSKVVVDVFDIHGRRVRSLTRAPWQAGYHRLAWDGRDGAGRRVGAGVYLYRMAAGDFNASRKLVVLP